MAKKETYGAENITVLEGLEAVRVRPGMYIGSVSTKGLNHLIYEIVDNSVDEHLAGYCTEIQVTLDVVFRLACMKKVLVRSVWFLQHFMPVVNLIMRHTRPAVVFMVLVLLL